MAIDNYLILTSEIFKVATTSDGESAAVDPITRQRVRVIVDGAKKSNLGR